MLLKLIALGAFMHKGAYARDAWNNLDGFLVSMSIVGLILNPPFQRLHRGAEMMLMPCVHFVRCGSTWSSTITCCTALPWFEACSKFNYCCDSENCKRSIRNYFLFDYFCNCWGSKLQGTNEFLQ